VVLSYRKNIDYSKRQASHTQLKGSIHVERLRKDWRPLSRNKLKKNMAHHLQIVNTMHKLFLVDTLQERSDIMKKGRNTAEILGNDDGSEDIGHFDSENQERTLILKAAPRSRRLQLIEQGAKEMRCTFCDQIKPLAGAEESEDGWVCEDCVRMMQRSRQGRRKKA
jgi:hypothetical protein